jgi:RNA 2',3'-cyclic 3'-phosphodiesterase
MPRLFSAIEIPRSIAERLTMLRSGLSGARWIDPENYHLTLRFIGDVDAATARDFTHALGAIAAAPFELKLNGLGSFGGNRPRAIFAELEASPELEALQRANERAAREAGLPPEGRNFKPHVTLARLRGVRPDAVASYLERQGGAAGESFTVRRFVVFSSRNSVGGGPYVVEAAYELEDDFDGDGDGDDAYDDDLAEAFGVDDYASFFEPVSFVSAASKPCAAASIRSRA